jgi:hypothetical protein
LIFDLRFAIEGQGLFGRELKIANLKISCQPDAEKRAGRLVRSSASDACEARDATGGDKRPVGSPAANRNHSQQH